MKDRFGTEFLNKRVLVVGCGISGIGAAKLLHDVGADIVLYDGNDQQDPAAIRERFHTDVSGWRMRIVLGTLDSSVLDHMDLAVVSPGISLEAPVIGRIRNARVPIWGEIELAYHFSKGTLTAITGTNGKTTTTALTGEILGAWYASCFVVGNIGQSYTEKALETTSACAVAAEISSFQLETIRDFHPHVSAVLNITPDHLNRHHTMQCYIDTKKRIFENQDASDYLVLNADDPVTFAMKDDTPAQTVFFSGSSVLKEGYSYADHEIFVTEEGVRTHICYDSDLNILGRHNMENVMAAVAIARCLGVPLPVIQKVLRTFKAVPHRIEYTAEKDGVVYYNDSKGTNPDAAIKAVEAMTRPTLLIGGGYDKQSAYDEWIEAFGGKVRLLVLIGATADAIEACARAHGFTSIRRADTLREAVQICHDEAVPGDAVLLSPACASWDMFKSFEERGDLFKQYVRELSQKEEA